MSDDQCLFARDLRLTRLFIIFLSLGLVWIASDYLLARECIVIEGFYGTMLGSLCNIIGPVGLSVFLFGWAFYFIYYSFSIKLKQKVSSIRSRRNPFK